jgi:hypothetical protein
VFRQLGITHVLNVTNLLPNFFEDEPGMCIKYLKINIEDRKEVAIDLAFPVAFNFMCNAITDAPDFGYWKDFPKALRNQHNPYVGNVSKHSIQTLRDLKRKTQKTALATDIEFKLEDEEIRVRDF